ncbi:FIST C-terminal domain-containing protein [Candidatus Magnetomoraceae bacterium gMMP-13]
MKIGIGHSNNIDEKIALKEALKQCNLDLNGAIPKAGILFISLMNIDYSFLLNRIAEEFPKIELIGCTTDGEISDILGYKNYSILLTVFASDEIEFATGIGENISINPETAAKQAFKMAKSKIQKIPKLCITLPEGLTFDADVVKSLSAILGSSLPIFGGKAGDQFRLQKTYQFYKRDVYNDSLPILLIGGNLLYSYGIGRKAWKPIGKKHIITKAYRNKVYKIDNIPVIDFYKKYFGNDLRGIHPFPFAVYESEKDCYYLRDPVGGPDEDEGFVKFFCGYIPEGAIVRIAEATREDIISSAKQSISEAAGKFPRGKTPKIALLFSCTTRRHILGTRTNEEYNFFMNGKAKNMAIRTSGFYAYGELAPFNGKNFSYSGSIVTLMMGTK